MTKIISNSLLLMAFFSFTTSKAQNITLVPVWETDTTLKTPESVLIDFKTNVMYVSCINGQPNLANQESYISKINQSGKVVKLKFSEGLNATKGMGILADKLYVTEMTNVVEISLSTGKVLKRYPVTDAKFLNDIAVDPKSGSVYISDSGAGKIWSLKNGKIASVLDGGILKGNNGLLIEQNTLLIGNGDGSLLSMNLANKKIKTVAKVSGQIDGIAALGKGSYIVSEWTGKVWHINAEGQSSLLIDSSKDKINTADLTYNPKTKTLLVPTFFHNKVMAYRVQ